MCLTEGLGGASSTADDQLETSEYGSVEPTPRVQHASLRRLIHLICELDLFPAAASETQTASARRTRNQTRPLTAIKTSPASHVQHASRIRPSHPGFLPIWLKRSKREMKISVLGSGVSMVPEEEEEGGESHVWRRSTALR